MKGIEFILNEYHCRKVYYVIPFSLTSVIEMSLLGNIYKEVDPLVLIVVVNTVVQLSYMGNIPHYFSHCMKALTRVF